MKNFRIILFVVFLFCGKISALASPVYLGFEQRVLLSYLLQAAGESSEYKEQLAQRATLLLQEIQSRGIHSIKVQSFDEFLALWRGQWPGTQELDLDLKLLEADPNLKIRHFSSDNPEVQKEIEKYYREQSLLLIDFLKTHEIPLKNQLLALIWEQLREFGFVNGAAPATTPLQITKDVFNNTDSLVMDYMNEIEEVAKKISMDKSSFGSQQGIQRVIQLFVSGYFKELSLKSKKQAVSLLLELPFNATLIERFGAIVGAAGPQLQKLLQILAREKSISPKLRELFRELEANVRKVPWVQVEQILEADKDNYEFVEVNQHPLAAGTMAQVHEGRLVHDGQVVAVVIRFLKPGIAERVAEDKRILHQLAPMIDADPLIRADNLPRVVPIVDDLSRTVSEELALEKTAEQQKIAINVYRGSDRRLFKKYHKTLFVSVPLLFESKKPGSKLLVQEFVTGKKLDEMAKLLEAEIPDFKTLVIEQLARIWLMEVLFGEGFYHADLHQGNFKISAGDKEVHLNILDFGMSGVLTKELRANFMKLGAGVDLLKAEAIANAFWTMSVKDKNKTDYATFQKAIADEVLKVKAGQTPGKQFHEWISFAMDQGISLPYDFINLNRGYVILTKLLEETGSRYSMSLLAKRAGFRRPFKVAYLLFKAGDISLLDMLKMATRGFFQQKLSGPVDIEVKSVPESEPNIEVKSSPGSVVEEGTPSTENRKALSCQRSLMDRK